ncbi:MAG: LysM peptidoglycan-binding domain-containing protein [Thiolinea sp.]
MKLHKQIGRIAGISAVFVSVALAEPGVDAQSELDLAQLEQVLAQGTTYTVESGDSLSKISEQFYGSSDLWGALLSVNDVLLRGDPMGLQPGMNIKIPALDEALANNRPSAELPGEAGALAGLGEIPDDPGINPYVTPAVPGTVSQARKTVRVHSDWVYTEGVARAIRREYMTFENAGRIAYLDPNLKAGDWVKKGQVLAYQDQSRPAASIAGANAQLVNANTQLTSANSQLTTAHSQLTAAQSQIAEANARLVQANTRLAVAQANRMEAEAGLKVAQRNFQRYATLLKQNSASQLEYDNAEARLTSAKAGVRRAVEQINSAKADINVAKSGIATTKANFATAKANVTAARATVATAKAGVGTAKANMGTANITKKESYLISPIKGMVARINMEQGYYYSPQYIQAQTEQQLFNTVPIILIDPSQFEVTIRLPSDQYDSLRRGAEAYIDIIALNASLEDRLPDEANGPQQALTRYKIRGRIHSISPVLDTDLRNFIVTVRTTRGHQFLRDGENVSLWIRRLPARR